jgi:hypothetical protein
VRQRRVRRVFAVMVAVAGAAALAGAAVACRAGAGAPTAGAVASGGSWGRAIGVAGRLNAGGWAQVNSVSCASPGNCAARASAGVPPGRLPR